MRVTRTLRATIGAALTGALFLGTGGSAVADQNRDAQWPLTAFGAQDIWKKSTGKGVTVAVIEKAFRKTHQDLTGRFLPGKDFPNPRNDGAPYLNPGEDRRDHGTGMAGLIAGQGHGPGGSAGMKGLSPGVKLLPLTADKTVPAATRYAVDHGADVINMSFGVDPNTPDMCESIHYAVEKGVVVVAGVGNDGQSEKNLPSACPGAIGVGAVDEYGNVWSMSNHNSAVDLLAPGVDVPVLGGKSDSHYGTTDGTSVATAYVSATVALLREKYPDLTPGQIANRLVKTAGLSPSVKKKHLKLPDDHYGYGYIVPEAALNEDIPAGPAQGPLPMPKGKASKTPVTAGVKNGPNPNPPMSMGEKLTLFGGIGLGVLVVIGIIIAVVVAVRRRNNPGPQAWG
ncbi:S8 family peptidase [Streptomyces nigrescens]|uniref:S8 family serine peptidase n=1 Tax=Streptomyces nigrescens TaxID=1920 RepID=A0A640TJ55_STRNI|nr:S8 family serine peptidase [Streptomyces libani]WAT97084.1 S8 family serine peptidase [Streptomyces libani subsp. libani]GFE22531.1 type VII secretion-associated serine protease [Streptomyces libani subsp. libani]GGV91154.1 type VII secretion-associated serine protease [Streptomyces libani subsp. libani]